MMLIAHTDVTAVPTSFFSLALLKKGEKRFYEYKHILYDNISISVW